VLVALGLITRITKVVAPLAGTATTADGDEVFDVTSPFIGVDRWAGRQIIMGGVRGPDPREYH
jgi:hypothetical protein